jgi:anaerobic selenocysteine-containing dehydrogenase
MKNKRSSWDAEISKNLFIVCWAMDFTQHKNGVETIREYVNLLLLKGAIGKYECRYPPGTWT